MQGEVPTNQPFVDNKKNILLWNGDIFDGPLVPTDETSDTVSLLQTLVGTSNSNENILEVLAAIKGPYTLVYWNTASQKMWFGRDRLGRHSLLWHLEDSGELTLTSVAKRGAAYHEVPAVGIFMIDFANNGLQEVALFPWSDITEDTISTVQRDSTVPIRIATPRVQSPISLCKNIVQIEPSEQFLTIMNQFGECSFAFDVFKGLLCCDIVHDRVEELTFKLRQSIKFRSTIQPGICNECLGVQSNFRCKEVECRTCHAECRSFTGISDSVDTFVDCSSDLNFKKKIANCRHPKVGILFSGGLDSTIIAALAHGCIPVDEPIDLLNVAFECGRRKLQSDKVRSRKPETPVPEINFNAPDRQTGLQSYEELRAIFPQRQWNFVQIDICKGELDKNRNERIADLIHPLSTVLDDSLGCALWFASRKEGTLKGEAYISPARILQLGMGADEQLGGYARHRNLLQSGGWQALAEELQLDLARIASRNLGRDDRVVADHGCQGRYPFLDEEVVSYVSSLPPWARCYPTPAFPPGIGDKLLLRLAAWKLGLQKAATIPKRAFQFGSRIANSKEKGSDLSSRLKV